MDVLNATSAVILAGLTGAYLYVYHLYSRRYFLYMGLAWLVNALYIFSETQVSKFGKTDFSSSLLVTAISSFSTVFFWFAFADLRSLSSRKRWYMVAALVVVGVLCCLVIITSATAVYPWRQILIEFFTAALTAVPLIGCGLTFLIAPRENLLLFVRNSPYAMLARPRKEEPAATTAEIVPVGLAPADPPITHRVLQPLRAAKRLMVVSFLVYGSLQLTYPVRDWIAVHVVDYIVFFWIALIAKIMNASAIPMLVLADFQSTAEALRRRSVAEELGVLTASIEHDIRSPIGILYKEIANIRAKYQANTTLVDRLNRLTKQIARMEAAVSVIPSTRDLAEKFQALSEDVNIVAIVRDAAAAVKKLDKIGDIHIAIQPSRNEITVHGDRPRLTQAFVNLINNGIEACRDRGPDAAPDIQISCTLDRHRACTITIRDKGTGLSPDATMQIGRPFFSTKDVRGRNRGIGVFIATRVFGMHGGDLRFESDGSTYTEAVVSLPTVEEGGR